MDKWLKKSVEVEYGECSVNRKEENSYQSEDSQSKPRKVVRKYDSMYLEMGFTWNGDEEHPRPQCICTDITCCNQLANGSMCPKKLHRHFEKHFELKR